MISKNAIIIINEKMLKGFNSLLKVEFAIQLLIQVLLSNLCLESNY